ncbi:lysylphosphatidylglycerol synthase domain-containing protein [Noviherbaspirillum sp. ST9]|uniref:lysylphosphatidylglycerol synthase domain-containing protein n=1 Tax=Noviherbaspirillum sp. ST9 TaxID=3401606 RepID=UPI003B5872F0
MSAQQHTEIAGRRGEKGKGVTRHAWWPWTKRVLTVLFFAAIGYLLYTQAREVEWDEVWTSIRRRPAGTMLAAMAFAAASYATYSCFDLFGRYVTRHGLAVPKVMTVNFVSYAFNLNMGALVGGVAFRYRLYSRFGLDTATTTRVVAMSMLTNWLGYLLLAGLAFLWAPPEPPPDWKLDVGGLRVLGAALLAAAIAWLLLCAFSRRRTWTVRGHEIELPSLRLALLQLGVSTFNWLLIAATVYTLLEHKIMFPTVLAVMLVAAVAGVITHVPAGLGVLETVFVVLLSHQVPRSELLAALLAYRGIYYLLPLAVATVVYLALEVRARRAGRVL